MTKSLTTRRRSGTVYITVLIVSLVVALMAVSAGRLARLHLRGIRNTHERDVARLLAMSAIDHALVKFNNEPGWEATYLFDTEYPATPVTANDGTFTWKLVDLGSGQKRLDGIGRVGEGECRLSVNLGASTASDALQVPLLCGGTLYTWWSPQISTLDLTGGPACSNADLQNYGNIFGDVEAQTLTVLGTVTGTTTIPGTVRSLPNPASVFDYYMNEGTVIPTALLYSSGAGAPQELKDCVLSPTSNPYGAANPDGIYIIDNPGVDIIIQNCRIVGTLIVRNPGLEVRIINYVNWEPARGNWPALMVAGGLTIDLLPNNLTEVIAGTNLNPPGTQWQGSTDADSSDSYPNALAGIVYATGDVVVEGHNNGDGPNLQGMLICGGSCRLEHKANVYITYDNAAALDPPPGFGSGDSSSVVGGTWRQTPSP